MSKRPSSPEPSPGASGDLFDDEPKPNSPEDLGQVTPPGQRLYGMSSMREPDPPPVNLSSHAIQLEDARVFVDWIKKQSIEIHVDVTPGRVLVVLSGLGLPDLKWLCKAILQAGRAPQPETMKKAVVARDVRVLRPGGDPETTQGL